MSPRASAPSDDRHPRAGRRLSLLLAIAFAATSVGVLALPSATLAWGANSFSSSSEQQLFALTNQARASAGRRTLAWDSSLASIARWRSKDMIQRDYFSHTIPGVGKVFDVMTSRGYCYKVAGENIGWNNYPDDIATAQIQRMFMDSAGHRANILGTAWDHVGIGAYKAADGKKMWTVLFADKCGTTSKPKPKPTARPKPRAAATSRPAPRSTPRPTPRPTPTPVATPTPTPTPEPTDALAPRDATAGIGLGAAGPDDGALGDSGTGGSGTPSDPGLRVVDPPPLGGLLETIVGGVAGLLFGG